MRREPDKNTDLFANAVIGAAIEVHRQHRIVVGNPDEALDALNQE